MGKHSIGLKASALAVGTTTLLLFAPIAGADDPPDACADQPIEQQQQCKDQQNAAAAAQRAVDETKQGADQAKRAADQAKQAADQAKQAADQAKQGADQPPANGADRNQRIGGVWMTVNGVLTCVPNGATFRNNERVESVLPANGDPRC